MVEPELLKKIEYLLETKLKYEDAWFSYENGQWRWLAATDEDLIFLYRN